MRAASPRTSSSAVYVPMRHGGRHRRNIIAFARRLGPRWVVALMPRLSTQIVRDAFPVGDAWGNTRVALPSEAPATWTDAITGRTIADTISSCSQTFCEAFP